MIKYKKKLSNVDRVTLTRINFIKGLMLQYMQVQPEKCLSAIAKLENLYTCRVSMRQEEFNEVIKQGWSEYLPKIDGIEISDITILSTVLGVCEFYCTVLKTINDRRMAWEQLANVAKASLSKNYLAYEDMLENADKITRVIVGDSYE